MTEKRENNLPAAAPEMDMVYVSPEALGQVVMELMQPLVMGIGKALANNTAALEQIAAAQSIQNDRIEAMEKQIRLQTPVTSKQASYLNDAIRAHARELLEKKDVREGKATVKLGNAIRKAVLMQYGIASLRELPRFEYNAALSMIGMWNDALTVWDIAEEARTRMAEAGTNGGPAHE